MAPDTSDGAGTNVESILVVEDEVLIRLAISQYLRDCGFRIIEATNAEEALTVLRQKNIAIDTILSDVQMLGPMDGFGLARWVREHKPGVPIILVGSAADAAADLCEDGPTLSKPYQPEAFVDKIRHLLAERWRISKPE